ncbi:MAG: OmpA family protein [Spirochaetales bacterium]|nr:OmpA family protein [Spirochaetales bacterium]
MNHLLIHSIFILWVGAFFQYCVAPARTRTTAIPAGVSLATDRSTGPDDGRFTLGIRGERIMYGYPIPLSTSHFVIRVENQVASNYAGLGIPHIASAREQVTRYGVPVTEMQYRFHGVDVIQRLVPLNVARKPEPNPAQVQYFRIEYEIKNQHTAAQNVGLMLLIDTMIDDNDAAPMEHAGRTIATEGKWEGPAIPGEVLVYRAQGDLSQLTGQLILGTDGAVLPDTLYIGRWPVFHSVLWDYNAQPVPYGDSAVLARWSPTPLAPGAGRTVATIYGLHPRSGSGLRALYDTPTEQKRMAVFFDSGSSILTREGQEAIKAFLRDNPARSVLGVVAEAGADLPGTSPHNFRLSLARAKAVQSFLASQGVPATHVIPKAFGDSRAQKTIPRESMQFDLPKDMLYYARREAAVAKMPVQDYLQKLLEDRFRRIYGIGAWGNPDERRVDLIFILESGR